MDLYHCQITTPIGKMVAYASERGVCLLEFDERKNLDKQLASINHGDDLRLKRKENDHLKRLKVELKEYFSGNRKIFTVPIELSGSEFQQLAWKSLIKIPYGQTRCYQDQAISMKRPNAVRAVGRANSENKIAIIIPCHRVIGKNGKLVGYAGEIWRKEFLLELEQ